MRKELFLVAAALCAFSMVFTPGAQAKPRPTTSTSIPVGDLPGWRQVYAEDFNTPAGVGSFTQLSDASTVLTGPAAYTKSLKAYPYAWPDTTRRGVYDPASTLSAHDGVLDVFLHTEGGMPRVSAPVPALPIMLYGRFSVRFKASKVPGYKLAWLLWPDSEKWPADGETDFPEVELDGTDRIHAYAHYADPAGGQDGFDTTASPNVWHVATIEWTSGRVVFILDGKTVGVSTVKVPSTPMHWVLQTETSTMGTPVAPSTSGHVLVDWVVAYQVK